MDENLLTTTNNPGSLAQPNTLEDKSTTDLVSSVFAPASTSNFSVDLPGTFQSSDLAGDTTLSDVADFRSTEEAKQVGAQSQIDEFDTLLNRVSTDQPATAFSDPETFLNTMLLNRTPSEAEESQRELLDTSAERTGEFFGGIQDDISEAQERFGVAGRQESLATTRESIANRLKQMREDLRAFEVNAEQRGVAREFVQDAKRKLTADATAELADLSIIESAQLGNLEEARGLAQNVIDEKYRALEAENTQTEADLARLIPTLEGEAKDRAIQVQVALTERARKLEETKASEEAVRNFAITAASEGADQGTVSAIMNATSREQAQLLASPFIGKLDRLVQQSQLETQRVQRENLQSQIDERGETGNGAGTLDGKAQTAAQASANGFADRLVESNNIFGLLGDQFAGKLAVGGELPNRFQSPERQQFEQAKRNFVNAILRRESGAAISPAEFDNAGLQYFAQPGDSPEVLTQKANNRNTVINNLYREANTFRPVNAGDIIESDGKKYQVGADGQTITPLE